MRSSCADAAASLPNIYPIANATFEDKENTSIKLGISLLHPKTDKDGNKFGYKIGKRILNKFNLSKVYESIIIFNDLVQSQIQKKVEQDNIKLRYLIGNNDKIRCREFINIKSRKMGKIKINKRLDKNKE